MSKFKVGDRVRVSTPDSSGERDTGGTFCVTYADSEEDHYPYRLTPETRSTNAWGDHELELVTTNGEEQRMGRRTFKQLQESVTVKKGALWQEACDDGDQEYILLDQSFNKDTSADGTTGAVQRIFNRSLVEDNAKHFVEVFKVEPQYMTRDELDKWEAFKGRKKPGPKVKKHTSSYFTTGVGELRRIELIPKSGRVWTPEQRKAQSRKLKRAWKKKKENQ